MSAMSLHPGVEVVVERLEIVESVRPRLADVVDDAAGADLDLMIGEALDELSPVRVTTYLPILVERRVRDRLRPRAEHPPV